MPRKRTRGEMEASETEEKKQEPSLLSRIRNMWEFASVMQYIFTFGKAVKIDEDFDIEDFENECLKPGYSEKLEEIGLTLLKWISSHRGLNYDIWDEYTRRQYLAKAPQLNPYGDEEDPKRFRNFDIFTKIRVLHQLTVWTFWNPDRMREKMPEHPRETDQTEWRIEEFGYDRHDRQYYLLDDNRFYRRTDPPLPPAPKAKLKANSKKAIAARRRESKRRKLESETPEVEDEQQGSTNETEVVDKKLESWEIDTLGGYKWECVAITLSDYHELCESLKKTKDPNEKALRERLTEEVIPVIEAAEEKQRRKIERRERELMLMEKMVGAKRSSRLADKHDRERREAEEVEAERKRLADLAAAQREQERQEKMERERQYRMMTREQRIKDREYRRILKEEELARDALEQQRIEEGQIRGSGRHLKERIERNKKELEDLDAEEDWTFDCSGCGMHGKNFDDGSHSVACERCGVWQHSKCLGISKSAAEKDDFHFVCDDCKRKEEDAKKPKISLKFKVGTSSSPFQPSPPQTTAQAPARLQLAGVEIPSHNVVHPPSRGSMANGYQSQSSPPSQSAPSPSRAPHVHNDGTQKYAYSRPAHGAPQHAQPNAASNGTSLPNSHPRPIDFHQGHLADPLRGNQTSQQPYPIPLSNGPARSPPLQAASGHSPYSNGTPYQYQHYLPGQRPLSAEQNTPRQPSQTVANGQPTTGSGRLPSPVINRPTMSPTQGNMDVGPVAGIGQRSPARDQHAVNGTVPSINGYPQQAPNGVLSQPQGTPRPPSQAQPAQTPKTQPFSGLSPKKQQTPVPLSRPSVIPQKPNNMSPPLTNISQYTTSTGSGPAERRTVSGTPILPPVEDLRPSPEQLRNMSSTEPVPTPSKQSQPSPQPVAGMEGERSIQGPATSGPANTGTSAHEISFAGANESKSG
ncbi:hypothetical protein A1O3_05708 [Capronia epimyces CBS 606.96]|uniref:PHD-type domain-containing protein n=1 Tax=Capronia epimyces CBS 606.96 TaxID=1182542 RepID=W9XXS6_9EURO|nr:uncharacterized protein A1O3_05708 [Capronia epimyces CBS 606.96]EXJ85033.1 hypothetical protein A1O3_05708 [Capronia epimyces CBS 606.96]